MANIIIDDDKNCYDLDTNIGRYQYLAKYLDKQGAGSDMFSHLERLYKNAEIATDIIAGFQKQIEELKGINNIMEEEIETLSNAVTQNELEELRGKPLILPSTEQIEARKKAIDGLVDMFLAWELPRTVCSDSCVTVKNYNGQRTGTNLLNANEAKQMIKYLIDNLSLNSKP